MVKADFFLKDYSINKDVLINYEGINLSIESDKRKVDNLIELKQSLEKNSETATLRITDSHSKEKSLDLAIDIKNLLSIGLGKRITFDRQLYWKDNSFEEVEKSMSKNHNMGEQIVPDFEIENYLNSTLVNWRRFSKKEKDDIFIITDYLNQTKIDFIEDRILKTVQAWECAAMYWQEEIELSEDLKDLKAKLKNTFNNWKTEKEFNDFNGELGTRILSSIEQEKLLLRLNQLVTNATLKTNTISLNLRALKTLRDAVVHTGRINISSSEAIEALEPGVFGLQLLLLKKLGYNGLVMAGKDGSRTFEKLESYFD